MPLVAPINDLEKLVVEVLEVRGQHEEIVEDDYHPLLVVREDLVHHLLKNAARWAHTLGKDIWAVQAPWRSYRESLRNVRRQLQLVKCIGQVEILEDAETLRLLNLSSHIGDDVLGHHDVLVETAIVSADSPERCSGLGRNDNGRGKWGDRLLVEVIEHPHPELGRSPDHRGLDWPRPRLGCLRHLLAVLQLHRGNSIDPGPLLPGRNENLTRLLRP